MTTEQMADAIVEAVRVRGYGVSFVELQDAIGDESRGDLAWEIVPNVVIWSGMSEQFLDALKLTRHRIEPTPTSRLVYLCDGAVLPYPLAKQLSKKGYKKPHWCPVAFNLRKE